MTERERYDLAQRLQELREDNNEEFRVIRETIAPPDGPPDAPSAAPADPADARFDHLPPLGPFAPEGDGPKKYIVGGLVTVAVARERVQYLNAQGKLITESLRDYTRINLTKQYDSLDKFLQAWNDADHH